MFKTRKKILKELEKLEENRGEILSNLKEKEVFYPSKYLFLAELMGVVMSGYLFYLLLKIAKQKYNYVSALDYCTSPYFISSNLTIIIVIIFSVVVFTFVKTKINLGEKYIKIYFRRKIYFDDIVLVEIRKFGDIEITKKSGKKVTIVSIMNNPAKILFILKENLKDRVTFAENKEVEKKKFVKDIFKVIAFYIFIECVVGLIGNIEDKISEKYKYDIDFSKYGTVREEFYDGGYAEYNYKHGMKNGMTKYYDFSGTLRKEIEYKNNKEAMEKEYGYDGLIASEIEYDKNGEEKRKKYYSFEGKLKEELTTEGDLYERKLYAENGSLMSKEILKEMAMYQGEKIVYYPNGKEFIKAKFNEKGKIVPPVKVYDDTGKLRLEEEYDEKQEYYIHRIFDEKGKLIKTEENTVSDWQDVYSIKMKIINYFENEMLYENEIDTFENILEN